MRQLESMESWLGGQMTSKIVSEALMELRDLGVCLSAGVGCGATSILSANGYCIVDRVSILLF